MRQTLIYTVIAAMLFALPASDASAGIGPVGNPAEKKAAPAPIKRKIFLDRSSPHLNGGPVRVGNMKNHRIVWRMIQKEAPPGQPAVPAAEAKPTVEVKKEEKPSGSFFKSIPGLLGIRGLR